jgi:acetyl-CoA acyltransferase
MREAVIVSAVRTAVGKAPAAACARRGRTTWRLRVIAAALERAPGIAGDEIDDVIMGCAMPEAEQGLNVARIASLRAGLPVQAAAVTVNRFCASGLQSIAYAAERVLAGGADAVVAGGTESMSLVPMGGNKVSPNPTLVDRYPDVYLTTGLVAENHAREFGIGRDEQDAFALRSHQRALAAQDAGLFNDEIVRSRCDDSTVTAPVRQRVDLRAGRRTTTGYVGSGAGQMKPAFHAGGTVTAGNSSQTSDGAAAVLVTVRGLRPVTRPHPAGALRGDLPRPAWNQNDLGSVPCRRSGRSCTAQVCPSPESISWN